MTVRERPPSSLLFPGFERARKVVRGCDIDYATAGSGPAVLLLHGFPETHAAWHRVAPALAAEFSVVVADLPGYGDSSGPAADGAIADHGKRAVGAVFADLMARLGHRRFAIAGHDRGALVGHRMALDYPKRVRGLAALDAVPVLDLIELTDAERAQAIYHWFFLAQPAPLPERLVGAEPDLFLERAIKAGLGQDGAIDPLAMDEYQRCFRNQSVVAAACADHRAGLTVDLAQDRRDRERGRTIACPVLALWGRQSRRMRGLDPLAIWRRWAHMVSGRALPCGHFLMEEAAAESGRAITGLLRALPETG